MVFSLAYHFLHDAALAEEVAQDVFLELHGRLGALESPAHIRHWLRRVTAHRSIDQSRRRKVRPQVGLDEVPEPSSPPAVAIRSGTACCGDWWRRCRRRLEWWWSFAIRRT